MRDRINRLVNLFQNLPRSSKFGLITIAVLILAALPLTVLVAQQQQNLRQEAAGCVAGDEQLISPTQIVGCHNGVWDDPSTAYTCQTGFVMVQVGTKSPPNSGPDYSCKAPTPSTAPGASANPSFTCAGACYAGTCSGSGLCSASGSCGGSESCCTACPVSNPGTTAAPSTNCTLNTANGTQTIPNGGSFCSGNSYTGTNACVSSPSVGTCQNGTWVYTTCDAGLCKYSGASTAACITSCSTGGAPGGPASGAGGDAAPAAGSVAVGGSCSTAANCKKTCMTNTCDKYNMLCTGGKCAFNTTSRNVINDASCTGTGITCPKPTTISTTCASGAQRCSKDSQSGDFLTGFEQCNNGVWKSYSCSETSAVGSYCVPRAPKIVNGVNVSNVSCVCGAGKTKELVYTDLPWGVYTCVPTSPTPTPKPTSKTTKSCGDFGGECVTSSSCRYYNVVKGAFCSGGKTCCWPENVPPTPTPTPAPKVIPTTCASPLTLCGTSCVNKNTDEKNCGICGRTCSSNQTCSSGNCVTKTTRANYDPTCGGKYNSLPYGNFGDPNCDFNQGDLLNLLASTDTGSSSTPIYDDTAPNVNPGASPKIYPKITGYKTSDNARIWYWLAKVEGGYNPNDTPNCSTCGWGLFSMDRAGDGNGPYDAGNVEWHDQVDNAVMYNKTRINENFCYWGPAICAGIAPNPPNTSVRCGSTRDSRISNGSCRDWTVKTNF